MPGVVDFTHCDPVNGTCMCKANVDSEVNRICDTCLDGYWNISSDNSDGCQGLFICICIHILHYNVQYMYNMCTAT